MFIIQMHTAGRARERMDTYKISDFELLMDENKGIQYWKLTGGGETKNHKDTDQDMTKGGRIYFEKNLVGLNPGKYIQDFMSKLNPKQKCLFQRPQRTTKKDFKLHENPDCW